MRAFGHFECRSRSRLKSHAIVSLGMLTLGTTACTKLCESRDILPAEEVAVRWATQVDLSYNANDQLLRLKLRDQLEEMPERCLDSGQIASFSETEADDCLFKKRDAKLLLQPNAYRAATDGKAPELAAFGIGSSVVISMSPKGNDKASTLVIADTPASRTAYATQAVEQSVDLQSWRVISGIENSPHTTLLACRDFDGSSTPREVGCALVQEVQSEGSTKRSWAPHLLVLKPTNKSLVERETSSACQTEARSDGPKRCFPLGDDYEVEIREIAALGSATIPDAQSDTESETGSQSGKNTKPGNQGTKPNQATPGVGTHDSGGTSSEISTIGLREVLEECATNYSLRIEVSTEEFVFLRCPTPGKIESFRIIGVRYGSDVGTRRSMPDDENSNLFGVVTQPAADFEAHIELFAPGPGAKAPFAAIAFTAKAGKENRDGPGPTIDLWDLSPSNVRKLATIDATLPAQNRPQGIAPFTSDGSRLLVQAAQQFTVLDIESARRNNKSNRDPIQHIDDYACEVETRTVDSEFMGFSAQHRIYWANRDIPSKGSAMRALNVFVPEDMNTGSTEFSGQIEQIGESLPSKKQDDSDSIDDEFSGKQRSWLLLKRVDN